jgi:hypothetical protein
MLAPEFFKLLKLQMILVNIILIGKIRFEGVILCVIVNCVDNKIEIH